METVFLFFLKKNRIFNKEHQDPKRRKDANEMNWIEYHSVETIHNWLDSIKAEFPSYVNLTTIGNSYEGRSLKLLKLSKKEVNEEIREFDNFKSLLSHMLLFCFIREIELFL